MLHALRERRSLLLLMLLLSAGCASGFGPETVIEATNDCVDSARSVLVTVRAVVAPSVHVSFPGGVTFYIAVTPVDAAVQSLGGDRYRVSLPARDFGDPLPRGGRTYVGATFSPFYVEGALIDAVFSELPPDSALGASPPCGKSSAPSIVAANDPTLGVVLRISNDADPGSAPFTLLQLGCAGGQDTLQLSQMRFGDSAFESLPWIDLTGGLSYTLAPGQGPLVFDVPDQALPQLRVGFVRAWSSSATVSLRGAGQFALGPTVVVEPTSWGHIKARYRNATR